MVRWLACLGSLAIVLHLSRGEAQACSMVSTTPIEGVVVEANPGPASPKAPRNVAFLAFGPPAATSLDVARAADGTIVQARVSRELPLGPGTALFVYTLDSPLPAGAEFESLRGGRSFETGTDILASAPAAIELRSAQVRHSDDDDGCFGHGSCGAITTLDLDHREEPGAAFYGVYYGDSPEEVAAAPTPKEISTTTYVHVEEAFRYGARFVAVTVFDRAGYESAKSNVVQMGNEGEEGCSAAPHASSVFQSYAWIVAAAALYRVRLSARNGRRTARRRTARRDAEPRERSHPGRRGEG